MKSIRSLTIAVMALLAVSITSTAHADLVPDLFGSQPGVARRAALASPGLSPVEYAQIDAAIVQAIQIIGPKEGFGFDLNREEIVNVTSATLFTWNGISLDLDAYNLDGFGASINYNVGQNMNVAQVPLLQYAQYLYVGFSDGYRNYEDKWHTSPMPIVQVKFSF